MSDEEEVYLVKENYDSCGSTYIVFKGYKSEFYDRAYAEDHREFEGSLADCEAFIRLKNNGNL